MKIKKIVPIKTWIPWNPVAIKKIEPKHPSLKQKNEVLYSNNWHNRNKIPKKKERNNLTFLIKNLFLMILWCLKVIVHPLLIRSKEFNKGKFIKLIKLIPK